MLVQGVFAKFSAFSSKLEINLLKTKIDNGYYIIWSTFVIFRCLNQKETFAIDRQLTILGEL